MKTMKEYRLDIAADSLPMNSDEMKNRDMLITEIAASALPANHSWMRLEYETTDHISGTLVYAPPTRILEDLRIPLPVRGFYRIYLGIAASAPGAQLVTLGVRVRLERDPASVHIVGRGVNWWWEISENYWKTTYLDHDALIISNAAGKASSLAWIRLEALSGPPPEPEMRTMITTNDGYVPYRSLEEIYETFMPFADSPVKKIFFCVGQGDLAFLPSRVATNPEYSEKCYYNREYDRDCVIRLSELRRQHPDILGKLAEFVHRLGMEFHVSFRTGCVYMPGWPALTSRFYTEHPEFGCRLFDGTPVARLSYAAPEVQDHFLAFYQEALEYDVDGINLIWTRALPAMLFEEPFLKSFEREFHTLPTGEDDPRILSVRESLMTAWICRIRNLVNETARKRGRSLELSLTLPATGEVNREHGLNLRSLAAQELVDAFLIDGSLQRRDHEERLSNIRLDDFASACRGTKTKFYPRMCDATFNGDFLDYFRNAIASGAAGVFLWDGPSTWPSWNNIRHLTDPGAFRARQWLERHSYESQIHWLKMLGGVDAAQYPPHLAF